MLGYDGTMNPFLASVSYPQGWWNNEEARSSMFQAFQTSQWRNGLREADTPPGTVLKEVLLSTSASQAPLEDMLSRRLVVAEVAKTGVGLPSRLVSGRQFKYDEMITGLLEEARESGSNVWKDVPLLNALLVASRTSARGDMREVERWMEKVGKSYGSPLLGATVAEVVCALGWPGTYCWVLGQADIGRSQQKVIRLHRDWDLEGKASVNLRALWILLARSATEFTTPDAGWDVDVQKKREALESRLGWKGMLALCDHPSAFIRTLAAPALAELLMDRKQTLRGLSGPQEWSAAWRLVDLMRPISGVNRLSAELLSVVEQHRGPCPPSLEGALPIDLLQHGYARRMVQNPGDDRLSQWLKRFKKLSGRPGARPYQQVLAESLETSDVWPSSFDGPGWSLLQMESRLTIPEPSSGKPKVRM